MFSNIKVLIWDFDGTLYPPNAVLAKEMREAEYRIIMDHTHWSREKTTAEFNRLHRTTPSATETSAILCGITIAQAAREGENYFDRSIHLSRDERLISLFKALHTYTHYLLVNGIQRVTRQSLVVLGLSPDIFTEIVTSEIVGENKPSLKGFQYILQKTGLPPPAHLMIGDRELVDLQPAKKLGMKTCLVWSKEKSSIADVVIPTVYDVARLLP